MGSPKTNRVRLLLDFPSVEDLLDGFNMLVTDGAISPDVKVYRADALDVDRVPVSRQYVVQKPGDGRKEIKR